MDFTRPERCRQQRTGQEDRRSKFYETPDNLHRRAGRATRRRPSPPCESPRQRPLQPAPLPAAGPADAPLRLDGM